LAGSDEHAEKQARWTASIRREHPASRSRRGSVRDTAAVDDDRLRRLRLAAQRLTPETAVASAREATRAVVGVQAQDVRAAGLALRSRVPGLERAEIERADGLVRTWTVRGTVHLHDEDDLPWLSTLTGPRNRRRFDGLMAKRGNLEVARAMLGDLVAVLEDGPRDRASLLAELRARGHPDLGQQSVNIVIPWAAAQGVVLGLPDGRLRPASPPPPVEEDEALATLAQRYLAGYGPATAADLASWSGLPLGLARRALAALGDGKVAVAGELWALPGMLHDEPPPAPPALLLAAFDTIMLGHRTRSPLVAGDDDRKILPGGGMLRPVVLARGKAAGTWRLDGSGARRRTVVVEWFGRPAARRALEAEAGDVGRFLGVEVQLGR
jgi:hypothetical protein